MHPKIERIKTNRLPNLIPAVISSSFGRFFNKTDEKNPLKNSKELVFFYNSFDKFKINKVKIKEIIFGLKKESVLVNVVLDFEGFLKGEKETIEFKGNSKMELINNLGWKIVFASLI